MIIVEISLSYEKKKEIRKSLIKIFQLENLLTRRRCFALGGVQPRLALNSIDDEVKSAPFRRIDSKKVIRNIDFSCNKIMQHNSSAVF